ncbi:hypothetical protein AKJ45_00405 [candidate division MSBL1 archaeon SCGC-AAA261F19]|uniref:RNA-binding protein n=2 Tax=candidate division MSBL1 TaxID=215777 RepID=A0A133VBL6_9EURY|nr:hypothetical protein AKJ43_00400 [candidate division MSBL1 archaeon SCGC-AAA261D19]KXB03784.1 hypothetical protein AKJ45_00405 [candidate division MSBL1 archaeon SCGC-AAA261F19]
MVSERSLSIFVPASLTADMSNLKQKTLKIGQIGRALAIFRVHEVWVYKDDDPKVHNQKDETKLIATILRYMNTPQYLRKQLFPKIDELRYVGLLPPLRTPHHPLKDERFSEGDYREAVCLKSSGEGSLLDLGLEKKGFTEKKLEPGKLLTVKLGERVSEGRRIVYPVRREETGEYWGFKVMLAGGLAEGLGESKPDYAVGTSRYGQNFYETFKGIKINKIKSVAVAFGGPYAGLHEICGRRSIDPSELFDALVNTIPRQGTETVRTEEALIATLALLNVLV